MKYLVFLFTAILLLLSIRGRASDLVDRQTSRDTSPGTPYESTNIVARYETTEAMVKWKTFFFTPTQTKLAAPDVVKYRDRYFSIFTPGVSFLGLPLYLLGNLVGLPQQGAYLTITLISFLDFFLIYKLAQKLTRSTSSAFLSAFLFLFATNALPYSNTYTQHLVVVGVIISSWLLALRPPGLLKNIILGGLGGIGLLLDIPTALMLIPIYLYVISQHFSFYQESQRLHFSLNYVLFGLIIGALPFLALFGYYNYQTTGSPTTLAQSIGRAPEFYIVSDSAETEIEADTNLSLPYKTRKMVNGLYILLISNERGWFYFSPIIAIGLLGIFILYRSSAHRHFVQLGLSIIGITIISYSMFGDPWGGWSYGARYLIPASAVASIFISVAIDKYRKNILFIILFLTMSIYSIYVATLGAITTNSIPPKVEAQSLLTHIPYTYRYNQEYFINKRVSSSLVYNLLLKDHISVLQYLWIFVGISSTVVIAVFISGFKKIK